MKDLFEEIALLIWLIIVAVDGLVGLELVTEAYVSTETKIIYGVVTFIVLFITWIIAPKRKKN